MYMPCYSWAGNSFSCKNFKVIVNNLKKDVNSLEEQGLSIVYTTIRSSVHQKSPKLDEQLRRHFKVSTDF